MRARGVCPRCLGFGPYVLSGLCEECAADVAEARQEGAPDREQYELDRAEDSYQDYMQGNGGLDVA